MSDFRLNFSGYNVPSHTQGALERYIVHGIEPGGFLTAVLCNDLMGAMSRADIDNKRAIHDICSWIYNEAPSSCHGSYEKMENYIRSVKKHA